MTFKQQAEKRNLTIGKTIILAYCFFRIDFINKCDPSNPKFKPLKINIMDKYIFENQIINYTGFSIDQKYGFYFQDTIIYLSIHKVNTLVKL